MRKGILVLFLAYSVVKSTSMKIIEFGILKMIIKKVKHFNLPLDLLLLKILQKKYPRKTRRQWNIFVTSALTKHLRNVTFPDITKRFMRKKKQSKNLHVTHVRRNGS